MISIEHDLTFKKAAEVFKKNNILFCQERLVDLGIRNRENNTYTNLGFLLSDQCQYSININQYKDEKNKNLIETKEFKGSIFTQIEEALKYLDTCNNTEYIEFDEFQIIIREYPIEAIKEALMYAISYCDYNVRGNLVVNINKVNMEFISMGRALNANSEDNKKDMAKTINQSLVKILTDLNYIKSLDISYKKILLNYNDYPKNAVINNVKNFFVIILPNNVYEINLKYGDSIRINNDSEESIEKENEVEESEEPVGFFSKIKDDVYENYRILYEKQVNTVVDYLNSKNEISEKDFEALLGISKVKAYMVSNNMEKDGILKIISHDDSRTYRLK